MAPLRPTHHLRPHFTLQEAGGRRDCPGHRADSKLVWRGSQLSAARLRPFPCALSDLFTEEKNQRAVFLPAPFASRRFPGEAGRRGRSSRDRRCQGNVTGGNTFAQNENGEREQFSNLQAIREKGISGNEKNDPFRNVLSE